jgi:hypothetical protein
MQSKYIPIQIYYHKPVLSHRVFFILALARTYLGTNYDCRFMQSYISNTNTRHNILKKLESDYMLALMEADSCQWLGRRIAEG